jgi:glucokinase
VSCGGPLDPVRGIIQAPPNLATWDGIAICDILKAEFGVPCYLENDANAGALAESKFGAGRGAKNLIFLTMGTGLGAGLILNGQLYRGVSHAAGEIGHVRLTRNGPQGHGRTGTVEGWASGGGMAQLAKTYAKSALNSGKTTLLSKGPDLGELNAHDVWIAARAGDAVAQAVVGKVGQRLGEAMAMLIDLINPDCIVVGGLAVRFGEDILQPARDVVMREALHGSAVACRILPAALGEQIGDVAALCVAMEGEIRDQISATSDESVVQRQYV